MSHQHDVFHNPAPATPARVRAALDRGDLSSALDAMVGAVLPGHGDWRELQELYLGLLDHGDRQVRLLAATCLGHVARVHGRLDEDRVVPALERRGATNALDDIRTFLHPRAAPAVVVEIHVPLIPAAGDSAFPWIDDVEDLLVGLEEDGTLTVFDDGEEEGDVYIFSVTGATEADLLIAASRVAALAGVPAGAFAVITDDGATEFGAGHRAGLPVG